MSKIKLLCLVVAAGCITGSLAVSEENRNAIRKLIIPLVMECAKEKDVPQELVKAADAKNNLDQLDECLLACVYKKAQMINAEGNFDPETATTLVKNLITGDDQATAVKIIQECAEVNKPPVKDGAAGCERAKLLTECYAKYKETFRLL